MSICFLNLTYTVYEIIACQDANIYDKAVKEAGEPWAFNSMGFHRDKRQIPKGQVSEKIGKYLPECSIRFRLDEGPPRTLKRGVVEIHEWPTLN